MVSAIFDQALVFSRHPLEQTRDGLQVDQGGLARGLDLEGYASARPRRCAHLGTRGSLKWALALDITLRRLQEVILSEEAERQVDPTPGRAPTFCTKVR